jgi:hypothetical protein
MDGATVRPPSTLVGAFDPADWYKEPAHPDDGLGRPEDPGRLRRARHADLVRHGPVICDYFWNGSSLVGRASCTRTWPARRRRDRHRAALDGLLRRSGAALPRRVGVDSLNNSYDVVAGLWGRLQRRPGREHLRGRRHEHALPVRQRRSARPRLRQTPPIRAERCSIRAVTARVACRHVPLTSSGMPATPRACSSRARRTRANVPFGDGLRCVTGSHAALPAEAQLRRRASYPQRRHGDPLVPHAARRRHALLPSLVPRPASFCTSATFNVSNALKVIWAP